MAASTAAVGALAYVALDILRGTLGRHGDHLRVTSLNVLNPNLAKPTWFDDPTGVALDPKFRKDAFIQWLKTQKDKDVICLQEIVPEWFYDALCDPTLRKRWVGYFDGYSGRWGDKMGVAVFVRKDLDVVGVRNVRLGEVVEGELPGVSHTTAHDAYDKSVEYSALDELLTSEQSYLGVRIYKDGETVEVGTVHMPCRFRGTTQGVMTTAHAALETIARTTVFPVLIVGDMNDETDGTTKYQLLVEKAGGDAAEEYDPRSSRHPEVVKNLFAEPSVLHVVHGEHPTTWVQPPGGKDKIVKRLDWGLYKDLAVSASSVDPDGPVPSLAWFSDHVPVEYRVTRA